jgi:hypothetical protein
MDTVFEPNYQNVVGFFARSIMRDLRLVGGFDVLFGKIHPGFHRQAERGGNLDHRNQGPGGPGRSGQVGTAATMVCRRDRT